MKKGFLLLACITMLFACSNDETKSSENNSLETQEASDTTGLIDKAQEKVNVVVDTLQAKGTDVIERTGDTIKEKIIAPVKIQIKRAGDKLKEEVNEVKDQLKRP